MAQKRVIELEVVAKGQKDLDNLNDTLEEQREILVFLERELLKVEQAQKKTSKTNLAAQKRLTDQAEKLKDAIKDQRLSLRQLNQEKRKALKVEKELSGEKISAVDITQLLDKFTGGYAGKIRNAYEGLVEMSKAIKATTLAQIKMNAAMLLNPIVVITTAVVGLTAAFSKYASVMTDGLVSTTESFFNFIKSGGNSFKFAALQAETYSTNLKKIKDAQDELQLDRAIKVLGAYGQETIDLEIQLAERKVAALKEGEEGYDQALTNLLVLRARKNKKQAEDEATATEKARQEKLKELQQQWALEKEAEGFDKEFYERFGKDAGMTFQEAFEQGREEVFDPNRVEIAEEYDPDTDPELQASLDRNNKIVESMKERDALIKQSRKDMLSNLIQVVGAESKVGKALIVAKGIQAARELAMDAAKTLGIATQSAARSSVAVAEGTAQTAKVGFPQNIPLLIGYAAQAAGIISSVKSALSAAKAPTDVRADVPTARMEAPTVVQQAPAFNVVGASGISQLAAGIAGAQPQRAYVVANDVTTAQGLERSIVEGASI
jgi:hypothetical protein